MYYIVDTPEPFQPSAMLAPLSSDPALTQVAAEVEQATIRMIDAANGP